MRSLEFRRAHPNQHSQRPSYGLNRTWRSTLNTQFQLEEIMFALAGRRLTGNVLPREILVRNPFSNVRESSQP